LIARDKGLRNCDDIMLWTRGTLNMQTHVQDFEIANGPIEGGEESFVTMYAMSDPALREVMIARFTASLHYANAESFMDEVLLSLRHAPCNLRWFIVRFDSIEDVDYVAANMLMELADRMSKQHVTLVFTGLCAEVKSVLSNSGVLAVIGLDRVFPSIDAALAAYEHLEK
jgi:MFS superfamily sulfate permease-like transporter